MNIKNIVQTHKKHNPIKITTYLIAAMTHRSLMAFLGWSDVPGLLLSSFPSLLGVGAITLSSSIVARSGSLGRKRGYLKLSLRLGDLLILFWSLSFKVGNGCFNE